MALVSRAQIQMLTVVPHPLWSWWVWRRHLSSVFHTSRHFNLMWSECTSNARFCFVSVKSNPITVCAMKSAASARNGGSCYLQLVESVMTWDFLEVFFSGDDQHAKKQQLHVPSLKLKDQRWENRKTMHICHLFMRALRAWCAGLSEVWHKMKQLLCWNFRFSAALQ